MKATKKLSRLPCPCEGCRRNASESDSLSSEQDETARNHPAVKDRMDLARRLDPRRSTFDLRKCRRCGCVWFQPSSSVSGKEAVAIGRFDESGQFMEIEEIEDREIEGQAP
jgi:hypothetical protein